MTGNFSRIGVVAGLALLSFLPFARATEFNYWPAFVRQEDSAVGRPDQFASLGPLFGLKEQSRERILSIRPLWTRFSRVEAGKSSFHLLYPFFNGYHTAETDAANMFVLVQYRQSEVTRSTFFQAFPFIFSNRTPAPESSYFAFWPIGGVLKERFWRDRISFALWPLYVRTEKGDETRIHVPYPFVQTLHGPRSRGFGLWPLYGHFERESDYDHTWALWPFFYNYKDDLEAEQPYIRLGALPFYHRETAAGLKSETFAWPFFGYTREWEPRVPYSENRYFWPLFVQGRGEEKYVNRWMPLYSRETSPGYEKNWYLWPFLKTETRTEPGRVTEKTSFLHFLFRDERQHFADATARLTTFWPLGSSWDDGKGRRQVQILDPLTVFFPANRKVKENWSPLFALYRSDEREGNVRHSFLWDLLVYERGLEDGARAVYLGPLFEWVEGSHWDVLKGLVGSSRDAQNGGLRLFWMNFNNN